MRLLIKFSTLATAIILSGCMHKGTNPVDPYEPINRKFYTFNMAIDKVILKPSAKAYKAIFAPQVRAGINNVYNNVYLIPSTANDLLQADWRHAIKGTWRFLINSTLGVGGIFDVADKSFSLPPHYNDFGLTLAKWGHKNSSYVMLPLLGPSTVRDGLALPVDYVLSPYAYLPGSAAFWSIAAFRYVDLRSQLLETDPIVEQAFDKYTFIRDAYLQRRSFLITGEQKETDNDALYVDEGDVSDYVDEPSNNKQPMTNTKHATHSLTPTRNSPQHG